MSENQNTADRDDFIHAMRDVACSVTVVTTDGENGRHGATVSAFCSVSADPPTLLVCLKADSKIAEVVGANAKFNVNVLDASLPNVALRFSGAQDPNVADRFDGIDTVEPDVLAGSRVFECDVKDIHRSGSHNIILGHVRGIRGGISEPLVYLNGQFRKMAQPDLGDE